MMKDRAFFQRAVGARRRALAVLLFGSTLLGGCLLTDLDGLSGAPEPEPEPVPGDGGATDTGLASDGAHEDAAGKAEVGTQSFCGQNPGHAWCEDFDEATSVPTLDGHDDETGALTIDGTSKSSPNALRIRYSLAPYTTAAVTKKLTSGDNLVFAFDIRADYTFTGGKVAALTINLPTPATLSKHFFYLESYGTALRLIETTVPVAGTPDYAGGDLAATNVEGSFLHFEITIDRPSSHVTVDVNGTRVEDNGMLDGFPPGAFSVTLGAFSSNVQGGDAVFHLDNVFADVK